MTNLKKLIKKLGKEELARRIGVTTRAIDYWLHDNRMPKSKALLIRYMAEGV